MLANVLWLGVFWFFSAYEIVMSSVVLTRQEIVLSYEARLYIALSGVIGGPGLEARARSRLVAWRKAFALVALLVGAFLWVMASLGLYSLWVVNSGS